MSCEAKEDREIVQYRCSLHINTVTDKMRKSQIERNYIMRQNGKMVKRAFEIVRVRERKSRIPLS